MGPLFRLRLGIGWAQEGWNADSQRLRVFPFPVSYATENLAVVEQKAKQAGEAKLKEVLESWRKQSSVGRLCEASVMKGVTK